MRRTATVTPSLAFLLVLLAPSSNLSPGVQGDGPS